MPKQRSAQVELPEEVSQELTLLRGFRDLVAERFGYFLGRRMKQAEMNEATKEERKAVSEVRERISGENLEKLISDGDITSYKATLSELSEARKTVNSKAKPFRDKISPLAKATRYIDSVAIPDSLKELGTPIQPRFSLSDWVGKALQTQKAKKN